MQERGAGYTWMWGMESRRGPSTTRVPGNLHSGEPGSGKRWGKETLCPDIVRGGHRFKYCLQEKFLEAVKWVICFPSSQRLDVWPPDFGHNPLPSELVLHLRLKKMTSKIPSRAKNCSKVKIVDILPHKLIMVAYSVIITCVLETQDATWGRKVRIAHVGSWREGAASKLILEEELEKTSWPKEENKPTCPCLTVRLCPRPAGTSQQGQAFYSECFSHLQSVPISLSLRHTLLLTTLRQESSSQGICSLLQMCGDSHWQEHWFPKGTCKYKMNAKRKVTGLERKDQLYQERIMIPASIIVGKNLPSYGHMPDLMKIRDVHIDSALSTPMHQTVEPPSPKNSQEPGYQQPLEMQNLRSHPSSAGSESTF